MCSLKNMVIFEFIAQSQHLSSTSDVSSKYWALCCVSQYHCEKRCEDKKYSETVDRGESYYWDNHESRLRRMILFWFLDLLALVKRLSLSAGLRARLAQCSLHQNRLNLMWVNTVVSKLKYDGEVGLPPFIYPLLLREHLMIYDCLFKIPICDAIKLFVSWYLSLFIDHYLHTYQL